MKKVATENEFGSRKNDSGLKSTDSPNIDDLNVRGKRGCRDASIDAPVGKPGVEGFLCPVDEAARIVGQKWTLQIVHHLLDGRSRRFCELQDALGKVNPSTLSSRLKMLEETGLVSRSQISDVPPHVEYRLTEMGAELRNVINEITRWSNAHLCATQSSPGSSSGSSSGSSQAAPCGEELRQDARNPEPRQPAARAAQLVPHTS